MSRLIDVDAMIDYLGFDNTEEEREENIGEIVTLKDFDEQPTAYDVDKVVDQLEKLLEDNTLDSGDDWYAAECLSRAIEIVKGGGIY